jgi:hypothetical protein
LFRHRVAWGECFLVAWMVGPGAVGGYWVVSLVSKVAPPDANPDGLADQWNPDDCWMVGCLGASTDVVAENYRDEWWGGSRVWYWDEYLVGSLVGLLDESLQVAWTVL